MSQLSALQLFGVIATHHAADRPPSVGCELVTFRNLGAVAAPCAYEAPVDEGLSHYRRVVESVFRQQEILPAPPGIVFRSRDMLEQWLELHYFSLLDALVFVEERAMARVTVQRSPHLPGGSEADEAAAFVLQEAMSVLRSHAAAAVAVGDDAATVINSMSFLVQTDRWAPFADLVHREGGRLSDHALELSGPWPPYDFIRMQFSN